MSNFKGLGNSMPPVALAEKMRAVYFRNEATPAKLVLGGLCVAVLAAGYATAQAVVPVAPAAARVTVARLAPADRLSAGLPAGGLTVPSTPAAGLPVVPGVSLPEVPTVSVPTAPTVSVPSVPTVPISVPTVPISVPTLPTTTVSPPPTVSVPLPPISTGEAPARPATTSASPATAPPSAASAASVRNEPNRTGGPRSRTAARASASSGRTA